MIISGQARLAGVIGWPVSHSLSPRLHAHWLEAYAIDGGYVPLPVPREKLSTVLNSLRDVGFAGVNVTLPHKEAAFALTHETDGAARAAGAVNLLVFERDRLIGRNTDVEGLESSLVDAFGADVLRGKTAIVLGAGGAARAAVLACDRLGAVQIRIVSRQRLRAAILSGFLKDHVRAELGAFGWDNWPEAAQGVELLVNATSAGMKGASALALDLDVLPLEAAVCDLVYNPLETELLKAARMHGHRAADGLGMLMHQAVPAFEAFFGVRPRVDSALRHVLEEALRHGG